jgi:integrase
MATIRQTKSKNWNVQIRRKGKLVASKTLLTFDEAEVWAAENACTSSRDHPLFIDAGYEYCETVLLGKPSQVLALNRIDRICKYGRMSKPMDQITLQDVNAFKQMRLAKVMPSTCRDELLMIRRVFRWYLRELVARTGKKFANPCELITLPPASKPRDRVISIAEMKLLMSAMTPTMARIAEIAFETAMRRSEILKLECKHLCLDERYLSVIDGKEGSRDVPLTLRACELLNEAVNLLGGEDRPLFDVAAYSVSQALRRARDIVGLDQDVSFHQLRHSRISAVARKRLNQAQIMMVSGHRDIRSVQRYTHLNVRDVIDLID